MPSAPPSRSWTSCRSAALAVTRHSAKTAHPLAVAEPWPPPQGVPGAKPSSRKVGRMGHTSLPEVSLTPVTQIPRPRASHPTGKARQAIRLCYRDCRSAHSASRIEPPRDGERTRSRPPLRRPQSGRRPRPIADPRLPPQNPSTASQVSPRPEPSFGSVGALPALRRVR